MNFFAVTSRRLVEKRARIVVGRFTRRTRTSLKLRHSMLSYHKFACEVKDKFREGLKSKINYKFAFQSEYLRVSRFLGLVPVIKDSKKYTKSLKKVSGPEYVDKISASFYELELMGTLRRLKPDNFRGLFQNFVKKKRTATIVTHKFDPVRLEMALNDTHASKIYDNYRYVKIDLEKNIVKLVKYLDRNKPVPKRKGKLKRKRTNPLANEKKSCRKSAKKGVAVQQEEPDSSLSDNQEGPVEISEVKMELEKSDFFAILFSAIDFSSCLSKY